MGRFENTDSAVIVSGVSKAAQNWKEQSLKKLRSLSVQSLAYTADDDS